MTISRIEHRTNPEVLGDKDLMPSQRILFETLPASEGRSQYIPFFSSKAMIRLGEVLAYDVSLVVDETQRESVSSLTDTGDTLRHLGRLAGKLLDYDPHRDPYKGYDRGYVQITDYVHVDAQSQDGYNLFEADGTPDRNGRVRFFTPEGFVDDPLGDFKQKLLTFDIKHTHIFVEDAYFNFSSRGRLRLYTNNLVAQPPRWEYTMGNLGVSDMQPGSNSRPYFLHAQPHVIANEELAQAVVSSLDHVIDVAEQR